MDHEGTIRVMNTDDAEPMEMPQRYDKKSRKKYQNSSHIVSE